MIRIPRLALITLTALGLAVSAAPAPASLVGCGHARPSHDAARAAAWREKHLAALHDKLKLTPEQEAAWQAYAGKTPSPQASRPDWRSLASLPAPERMDRILSFMKEREARLAEHAAALKALYRILTPAQQKIFDAQSARRAWTHASHARVLHTTPTAPVSFRQSAKAIWA